MNALTAAKQAIRKVWNDKDCHYIVGYNTFVLISSIKLNCTSFFLFSKRTILVKSSLLVIKLPSPLAKAVVTFEYPLTLRTNNLVYNKFAPVNFGLAGARYLCTYLEPAFSLAAITLNIVVWNHTITWSLNISP